jgi:hypothetical protein
MARSVSFERGKLDLYDRVLRWIFEIVGIYDQIAETCGKI